MFRCSEVAERASLMIDNEMGFWPRANMQLHLAMCRGCRAFIAQMRTTRDLTLMAGVAADLALQDQALGGDIAHALARRRVRSGKEI